MNYIESKNFRKSLEDACETSGRELRKFTRGLMGLTPDNVKATPEWKSARHGFDIAFSKLRQFNRTFTKAFKREILAERNAKYSAEKQGIAKWN